MKNIKKFRYQLGFTQQELAIRLGITRSHASFLEKKTTKTLAPETASKLCDLFGCSLVSLYGMENFKVEPKNDEERVEMIKVLIESLESEELKNEFQKRN